LNFIFFSKGLAGLSRNLLVLGNAKRLVLAEDIPE